jgi:hypothetical protein
VSIQARLALPSSLRSGDRSRANRGRHCRRHCRRRQMMIIRTLSVHRQRQRQHRKQKPVRLTPCQAKPSLPSSAARAAVSHRVEVGRDAGHCERRASKTTHPRQPRSKIAGLPRRLHRADRTCTDPTLPSKLLRNDGGNGVLLANRLPIAGDGKPSGFSFNEGVHAGCSKSGGGCLKTDQQARTWLDPPRPRHQP